MTAFIARQRQVPRSPKEKSASEAMNNILDALPCKACHDIYRDEKRPKRSSAITR